MIRVLNNVLVHEEDIEYVWIDHKMNEGKYTVVVSLKNGSKLNFSQVYDTYGPAYDMINLIQERLEKSRPID